MDFRKSMNKNATYNIKTFKTPNTWRFELHSRGSSRVLLWYSVPHNLLAEGKATFYMKVQAFYRAKKEKANKLQPEIKAKKLLTTVSRIEGQLFNDLQETASRDFLDKIIRVNIN